MRESLSNGVHITSASQHNTAATVANNLRKPESPRSRWREGISALWLRVGLALMGILIIAHPREGLILPAWGEDDHYFDEGWKDSSRGRKCGKIGDNRKANQQVAAAIIARIKASGCEVPDADVIKDIAEEIHEQISKGGKSTGLDCKTPNWSQLTQIVDDYLDLHGERIVTRCSSIRRAIGRCLKEGNKIDKILTIGTVCYLISEGKVVEASCEAIDYWCPLPVCTITDVACDLANDASEQLIAESEAVALIEATLNSLCEADEEAEQCKEDDLSRTCEDIALKLREFIETDPPPAPGQVQVGMRYWCERSCQHDVNRDGCVATCMQQVTQCLGAMYPGLKSE